MNLTWLRQSSAKQAHLSNMKLNKIIIMPNRGGIHINCVHISLIEGNANFTFGKNVYYVKKTSTYE